MSFFDAPISRCEAVREMVLTDQTQDQCAREHDCPPGFKCPLCGYFVEASEPKKPRLATPRRKPGRPLKPGKHQ